MKKIPILWIGIGLICVVGFSAALTIKSTHAKHAPEKTLINEKDP